MNLCTQTTFVRRLQYPIFIRINESVTVLVTDGCKVNKPYVRLKTITAEA